MIGLADHRLVRKRPQFGEVDDAVVTTMRQAIDEAVDASTRTGTFLLWRTGEILKASPEGHQVRLPSQRTLYRLLGKLTVGTRTTGSATTRRSRAHGAQGPHGELPVFAPGEVMQIDSTPLDVLVRLNNGVVGKVELTAMVDVATRTVTAAVLRPTTKSVGASVLLARTVTPELMRPGWVEALKMSRSVLPHRRLLALDERLEHAAARPVIVPELNRLRPREGVPLPQLPLGLPVPGGRLPADAQGLALREGAHREDAGLGGHAVRPVPARLHRPQYRPPRAQPGARTPVVPA
ncbi:hypothetical protein OG586_06965 [Streptomyces murinus]|nr:hypothetical protein [Streptomyces murinus]WUD05985.1 hypothetical protein OG586_06965 [Streptomyces murinus]